IPPVLHDPDERVRLGLGSGSERGNYVLVLTLLHAGGPEKAATALEELLARRFPRARNRWARSARSYYRCTLRFAEVETLCAPDDAAAASGEPTDDTASPATGGSLGAGPRRRAIYRSWPHFQLRALIARSVATVKADAGLRAQEASGEGIVWA